MAKKTSGVLLHITSLPSKYGIGDLGPGAYLFADFLIAAKQTIWQVLPLNPTNQFLGNCPYISISAFAGNTLLISPDILLSEGFLTEEELQTKPEFADSRCDYTLAIKYKQNLLSLAYQHLKRSKSFAKEFRNFCLRNSNWLDDFAIFSVIKQNLNGAEWNNWPQELKNREPEKLGEILTEHKEQIEKEKFLQCLFFRQWLSLKRYCNKKGIKIFGDIPIYVNYDSVDAWKNPEIFKLDKEKRMTHVSGVPPDYFSKTGQRWGTPVFDWQVLKKTRYAWWIKRISHNLKLFDLTRVDHFRGLVAFWQVPESEPTAINGEWVKVPCNDFFKVLLNKFPRLPIIAEDLGIITPDVKKVMERFKFPGMRVLLFAFGEDNPGHPYLPHNYIHDCVAYTGTHDNNTARGWFENEATEEEKKRLFNYTGKTIEAKDAAFELMRLVINSKAGTIIIPMQDILGLPQEYRMNIPGTPNGNWEWRLTPDQIAQPIKDMLSELTSHSARA